MDDDPVGVRSGSATCPSTTACPSTSRRPDVVSTFGKELAGLPVRAARRRASDMLDLVGLDQARFDPVSGFSTGMRQRTKLAQALVADPQLVLLDEPTAGLDPVGSEEMLELVGRLAGFGISAILATHLLDDVQRVCEHVVMIDRGHLVLAGPIDQLMQTTGLMRVEVGGRDGAVAVLARALAARGLTATTTPITSTSTPRPSATTPSTSCGTRWPTSSCASTRSRPGTARSTTSSSRRPTGDRAAAGADRRRLRPGLPALPGPQGGRRGHPGPVAAVRPPRPRAAALVAQKVFPWSLLGLATIPAVVNVGVAWVIRNNPLEMEDFSFITYREYVGVSTTLLLFVALTAPDVVPPTAPSGSCPCCSPGRSPASTTSWPRWRPSPPSCSASRSCPRSCCSSARCW